MNLILSEIITQALGFLLLVWVLKRLFWKPVLGALEARRQKIEASLLQIENSRKEMEGLRSDYEKRLEKIEEEARAKLQSAIDDGRRISREIQDKAREDAKNVLEGSKENLALEVAKARVELRREIAELTLLTTEKLLREKLTSDKQREKIMELIETLEEAA